MASLEGMRRLVATALAALCGLAPALAAPGAAQAAGCPSPVQITSLTFNPPQITPGQSSTATVEARNCSDQAQTFSVLTTARFLGPTSGIPAGCPVIDPLPPKSVTVPAGGTWTGSTGYATFAGCTATTLEVTARATDSSGTLLDTRTADLPIVAAPPPCAISYQIASQWNGGFLAEITVTDAGPDPIVGWTVGFTFPAGQRVVSAWDATITQAAAAVTAVAKNYNARIAPGASTTFGFIGAWSGSNPAPAAFTLNGAACPPR